MPRISAIVPVYNVEQYLRECLDSILSQSMDDFEVICVNDGSTDGSGKILEEYAARDKRITVVTQKNQGLSAARNAGVAKATGEYIHFIDSDDVILPDAFRILCRHIDQTQADVLVFGMKDIIKAPADPWFDTVSTPRSAWYTPFVPYALLYERGAYPFVWRNLYRRGMLELNRLAFEADLRYGEDIVYQFCVFPMAHRIRFIPDKLYGYRRLRKGSMTRDANENTEQLVAKHLEMLRRICRFWNERGLMQKYGDELYPWLLNFIVPTLSRVDEAHRQKLAQELVEILSETPADISALNPFDEKLRLKARLFAKGRMDAAKKVDNDETVIDDDDDLNEADE